MMTNMLFWAIILMPIINIGFNYIICNYIDPHKIDFEILNDLFYIIFYLFVICVEILQNKLMFKITDWILTFLIIVALFLIHSAKNKEAIRIVYIIFVIPIIEEYLYRFFIYDKFIRKVDYTLFFLIMISSVSFALLHYMQGKKDMIIKFILSVILSIIFIFTEEIMIVVVIHIIYNIFAYNRNIRRS